MCDVNRIRRRLQVVSPVLASGLVGSALAACGGSHRQEPAVEPVPVVVQQRVAERPRGSEAAARLASAAERGPVPSAIVAVGEYGEDAFDAVEAGHWARARALADSIRRAAAALPPRAGPLVGEIQRAAATLEQAVERHDRPAALEAANRLTYLSAELGRPYEGHAPTEVALMDYRGRELHRDAAARDTVALRQTASDIEAGWRKLRPDVEAHDAHGRRQARRFDDAVAKVKKARTPDQYEHASQQVLDDVDSLETVVTRR
jgi:hypothetical protein